MRLSSRKYSLLLVACVVVSFACVAYPLYVIRPFRPQGAQELAVALNVLAYRGAVTVLCAIVAVLALFIYWRQDPRTSRRVLGVTAAVLVVAFAVLSRVNIYEQMFHPDQRPSFSAAPASKLDGAEKVIAVNLGSAARAYPIRVISYHHVINDVVAGVPIVATY